MGGAVVSKLVVATHDPRVFRIPGYSFYGIRPNGYLVLHEETASLVDVPYFSEDLAEEVRQVSPSLSHIFLTHDDFVAMSGHEKWRRAFGGQPLRVAHQADAKGLEVELCGQGPWKVADFEAHHVPGHSAGSIFYLHRSLSVVFTGDSFASHWGGPTGFPMHCRYGRSRQAASLRGFAKNVGFAHYIFPSHGESMYFEDEAERMEAFEQAAAGLD